MQTCSAERQTHTRPARRPPQHSHHSALATSSRHEASDKHPFSTEAPEPSGSYLGLGSEGTPGHHQLLSPAAPAAEGPDDGSTPGTCPPATPTSRIRSFSPAHSKQKHWHSSACGVTGKAHPTTAQNLKIQSPAPAPASSLWHPLLQSRIPKSFALLV